MNSQILQRKFSKQVLILQVVKVVLLVEHLVKSSLQSIVLLMGSPQALVPTPIVHPVVHTVVHLYTQICIAMVIIYIALIHLTRLASYVVLVEVRGVIVIIEVTCRCTPVLYSNECRCIIVK